MSKPEIMIVEDELLIAEDIKICLRNSGYNISATAVSGKETLDKIKLKQPDLILMDIKLSGEMDGIETTRKINSLYNIPIVYLTANADKLTAYKARETEPYGFISKPIQTSVLSAVIEMALYKFEMENRVKDREAWLGAILEGISDAVIAIDVEGQIKNINPVATRLTGWSMEDSKDISLTDIFNVAEIGSSNNIINTVKTVIDTGSIIEISDYPILIRRDGQRCPICYSISPIKNVSGIIIGAVLVFRDITQARRIEEELRKSEQRLRLIADNTQDNIAITTFDLKASYLYVSPSVRHVLGYEPEDMLGRSFFEFIHPDDKKVLIVLMKKYITIRLRNLLSKKEEAITETIVFRFLDKKGDWRYMESTVNIIGNKLLAITRDISKRRQITAELEKELRKKDALLKQFTTGKNDLQADGSR